MIISLWTDLEVEVEQDDHLAVARLEEGGPDVVVQHVHLVPADRCVAEAVGVRLQRTCDGGESEVRVGSRHRDPAESSRLQGLNHMH